MEEKKLELEVHVEISKNSKVKYEFENNKLKIDRILPNTNVFPYNYGYVPDTLSGDGDPLDVIIVSDHELVPGCYCDVEIKGVIETKDEKGIDPKLYGVIKGENKEISQNEMDRIIYFLSHYKEGEKDKFVELNGIYGVEKAVEIYENDKVMLE